MIRPEALLGQVENTAAWAMHGDAPNARIFAAALTAADQPASLALLLAAHYTTVATFVPTDVDAQIRFHFWQSLRDADAIAAELPVVDAVAGWDITPVSARGFACEGLHCDPAVLSEAQSRSEAEASM